MPVAIPDNDPSGVSTTIFVTLPVTLEEGCGCTVDNVAITIGINHPVVFDLGMGLVSPNGDTVTLVDHPFSSANLVAGNVITFDDSVDGALDSDDLGANVDINDNILAATYFAVGDFSGTVNAGGLEKFNGKVLQPARVWTFVVDDFSCDNTGTIVSVELKITCE